VNTSTPMGAMLFTFMAALAQTNFEIKRERIVDSLSKRRKAGRILGGGSRRSEAVDHRRPNPKHTSVRRRRERVAQVARADGPNWSTGPMPERKDWRGTSPTIVSRGPVLSETRGFCGNAPGASS